VIATIPAPIVGGVYLALFGLIAAVGLSNLRRADMDSQRNLMIVGFLLFAGLVFPNYFGTVEDFSFFGIDLALRHHPVHRLVGHRGRGGPRSPARQPDPGHPRGARGLNYPWVGNPRSTPRWIGSAQREMTTFWRV
jgi:hypothetical protein